MPSHPVTPCGSLRVRRAPGSPRNRRRPNAISTPSGRRMIMNVALETKIRASAGALAVTLLLAGCATGPAYVRPTVDVPGALQERAAAAPAAPQPGWKPASPQDAQDRGAWWEIFNDASLNQLEARVTVSNQTIVMAVASLTQARAVVGEARAAYFPTVQAGIEPDRLRTSHTVI